MKKDTKDDEYNPNILKVSKFPQIDYYPKYWAERPNPLPGELLSSWMIRTALANMTDIYSLLDGGLIQFKKIEYYIFEEEHIKELFLDNSVDKYEII